MVNSFRKIKARELLLDLPLDVADDIPEKSHFMKNPVYIFLIFNISGKGMKQKLSEMFQVTVPIFFYFDEI